MSHLLPRYRRAQLARARRTGELLPAEHVLTRQAVDQAVQDAEDRTIHTVARATLPGDTRRLRGIPVTTYGVAGTAPGTDPLAALIRRWTT